jgi:hypothetical protein
MPMFLAVAVLATPVTWTVGGLCVLARRGSAAARASEGLVVTPVHDVAVSAAEIGPGYVALPAAA